MEKERKKEEYKQEDKKEKKEKEDDKDEDKEKQHAEANNEMFKTDQEKPRIQSAKLDREKPSYVANVSLLLSLIKKAEYVTCIRAMCEHDEGWHMAESFVAFPKEANDLSSLQLDTYAAYLARVMSIIKSGNTASEMRIFFSDEGRKTIDEIERRASAEKKDMDESYVALRKFFADEIVNKCVFPLAATAAPAASGALAAENKDINGLELELCELKNGKTAWLCPTHMKKTNATVIRNSSTRATLTQANNSIYNKMLKFIKNDRDVEV